MPDFGLSKRVLFRSILQQDVKPLARALMRDAFGNLDRVRTASEERLHQIRGARDTVITDLKTLEPKFSSWSLISASFGQCFHVISIR